MERKEIVRRAIKFENPPRLPFFLGSSWSNKLSAVIKDFPNDVCDTWEMDRQEAGWFFDNPNSKDDWGCQWAGTEVKNMGQVVKGPLEDWSKLSSFIPPNPKNPFYFARIENEIKDAGDKYVVITSHFNIFERLYMLHGFTNTLEDFYMEPEKIKKIIELILEYKIEHITEAHKHFGDRINGIFLTDDWGTQSNTFVSEDIFNEFFAEKYKILYDTVHSFGWHAIQHSCGKINDFVPLFIKAGVDVMNMQQPTAYGIEEIGKRFAGKICFLTTVDIQNTLPSENAELVRKEAKQLVENWSTFKGGFIVFNYGDSEGLGTSDNIARIMFEEFYNLKDYWSKK